MNYQTTFKRYELKYLLTPAQKALILQVMQPHMALDRYGRTAIRNIYFDTENFRLIRRSLEKPAYKEKLRIRSYRAVGPCDDVFVELKKKYRSVVYKRRLVLPQDTAVSCFRTGTSLPVHSQIASEIDYFRSYYRPLFPTVFLSYEREAYAPLEDGDFRVTFDENILYRTHHFSLSSELRGTPLLSPGQTLMELKTSGGIPLWMSHALTVGRIYQTSFSKYGSAYQNLLAQGGIQYA